MKNYFYSPIGYVFIGIFMLVLGILFLTTNISAGTADFAATMHTMSTFFVFLLPLLTMRSFAEERRAKTDQLLLTAPVSITKTVLGKFFACMTVLAAALLVSLVYPLILAILGSPQRRRDFFLLHRIFPYGGRGYGAGNFDFGGHAESGGCGGCDFRGVFCAADGIHGDLAHQLVMDPERFDGAFAV